MSCLRVSALTQDVRKRLHQRRSPPRTKVETCTAWSPWLNARTYGHGRVDILDAPNGNPSTTTFHEQVVSLNGGCLHEWVDGLAGSLMLLPFVLVGGAFLPAFLFRAILECSSFSPMCSCPATRTAAWPGRCSCRRASGTVAGFGAFVRSRLLFAEVLPRLVLDRAHPLGVVSVYSGEELKLVLLGDRSGQFERSMLPVTLVGGCGTRRAVLRPRAQGRSCVAALPVFERRWFDRGRYRSPGLSLEFWVRQCPHFVASIV